MKRVIAAAIVGILISRIGSYGFPIDTSNEYANAGILLWVGPLATDQVCGIELYGEPGAFCGNE